MKSHTLYSCSKCDAQFQKWMGRCTECNAWGSIDAAATPTKTTAQIANTPIAKTVTLKDVSELSISRTSTTMSELDRVLGGGIVPGSLILLGGEPGIGKSTLSLQLAATIPHTVYISGEESAQQIKLRADRLGISSPTLELANETTVETICATLAEKKPTLAIIDSIQTIQAGSAQGEAGNVTQIRACTALLLETAKKHGIAMCIIGHVTKDGAVAGPKTLEHLVDTVLYLEGEKYQQVRMLRAVKNRFGATDEVGLFEMRETGLFDITNASALLLEERDASAPGSVITCLMEGTRPVLIEVQALVNKTTFGYPVRKASGFDLNRLYVLAAVLQKRAGLDLGQYDIHINIVGGMKAQEPAVDLAVCLAIASSYKDKVLGNDLAVFGEVGLQGEVRSVTHAERRLKECAALGMKRVILAKNKQPPEKKSLLKIIPVENIQELISRNT